MNNTLLDIGGSFGDIKSVRAVTGRPLGGPSFHLHVPSHWFVAGYVVTEVGVQKTLRNI